MAVKFLSPIANASQFPVPTVSASPKFRLSDVNLLHSSELSLKHAAYTRNGRGAIGIAGKALKKPGKNVILIPAYHCPALVEPFIWLDYEIRFYPVNPDLTIDVNQLKIALSAGDVTHCVVIRYFGFSQNIQEVVSYLDQNGIYVVEDCAHALFAFLEHFSPKKHQDDRVSASICSINKILPTIDGGALYLKQPSQPNLQEANWADEAKACAFLLGIPQFVGKLKSWLGQSEQSATTQSDSTAQTDPEHEDRLRYFQPVDLSSASYRHTHYILSKSDLDAIKIKRRRNYQYLLNGIANPAVGKVLFSQPEKDVPYVMPFLLSDDKHFFTLRSKGIQILRWEEIAISDCTISQEYRSRLIQIPCHQQLKRAQLDYIITTFNQLQP